MEGGIERIIGVMVVTIITTVLVIWMISILNIFLFGDI